MSIKAVLFDLDGTLLPMDNEELVRCYFSKLCAFMAKHGYDPESFKKAIFGGTGAMMKNDGQRVNEDVFWEFFTSVMGEVTEEKLSAFDEFYRTVFREVRAVCGYSPMAKEVVRGLTLRGIKVAVATQPVFPRVATEQRISWSGVDISDVSYFTSYENSHFCKPNLKYYEEITRALGVLPEECVMVGNDADEDMIAEKLGMKVFLLTDDLINRSGRDISVYNRGGFSELAEFLDSME